MVLVIFFFEILKIFCFVVAMSDVVHDVQTMHGLCKLLIAFVNLF